ncbi:RidA family protein [Paenibacillus sp. FSL K6-0276]|uniref:RidA family protein n=1 Tax=Paenibacillus sp. FSL K6-0276 TaxID=2921450 RepID=UPI0030EB2C81
MINRISTPFSYSSAVEAGDYVFLGLHRGFGVTFTEQIHNTFSHLKDTLNQLDVPLQNVVKVNVYLKNILQFKYYNGTNCTNKGY